MNILIALSFLFLSSCVTPVKSKQWGKCVEICETHKGLVEAAASWTGKKCCRCVDKSVVTYNDNMGYGETDVYGRDGYGK